RSYPDDLWDIPRRRRQVPAVLSGSADLQRGPIPGTGPGRRRSIGEAWHGARPFNSGLAESRDMRRAWRRTVLGGFLPSSRAELCFVLAVPGANREAGCRASRSGIATDDLSYCIAGTRRVGTKQAAGSRTIHSRFGRLDYFASRAAIPAHWD